MNLLAIDTSTDYLNIAVLKNDRIAAKLHRKAPMAHSSLLIPMIDKVLKKAKLKLKDISAFCISTGPGSFTGLRIGVTTVKGLAFALNRPIVTVPTFDAIAWNGKGFKGVICPVLDARKNKVYACLYKSDGKEIKRISKYLLLTASDLAEKLNKIKSDILFLGDAVEQVTHNRMGGLNLPYDCVVPDWHPKAKVVAALGLEAFKKRRFVKPEELEPMYIYSKECDITGR